MESEDKQIGQVVERLARKNSQVAMATVATVVEEIHAGFGDSQVRDFIPLLVERKATRRLSSISVR